ncbi:hypothetical protein MNBD_NITROSPINAE03-1739 [hydrothermal vent metagenome]|uniref:Uncharacterized protein n=1 Tax=hydrothermal vent metagenome TaxID=652676 RepID=A0A3B1BNR2_9ZZZZ
MNKSVIILLLAACVTAPLACAKQKEPEKKTMTTREKAEAVGKFGDSTLTNNLEKNLTGIIDKTATHNEELDRAANQ